MRKLFSILVLVLISSAFSLFAEVLLTAEKGYGISLTKEIGDIDWVKHNSTMQDGVTAKRNQLLYLIGPFSNKSGKTQALRLGVELKEQTTNECFYHLLVEEDNIVDGLQLLSVSLYPNFIIRNGTYEVRAVCMDMSKDAAVSANWEYVSVPSGFSVPLLNVTGDEPVAYFSSQPYVGNPKNVAEVSDTKLHVSLSTLSSIENGALYAFVFEPDGEYSIGYYMLSFSQAKGETKEYVVEYKKSGSHAADLVAGKSYELSFNIFENKKEQFFDSRYEYMKFSVTESGSGIFDIFQSNRTSAPGRKFMLEDGTFVIEHDGCKYRISGTDIK